MVTDVRAPAVSPLPTLTSQDLTTLRTTRDRWGLVTVGLLLVTVALFVPLAGALFLSGLAIIVLLHSMSLLRHILLVAQAAPLETAHPTWAAEMERLLAAIGRSPGSVRALVITHPDANAFATYSLKGRVIVFTTGLVDLLGDDLAAFRFVAGHELGHLVWHFPVEYVLLAKPLALPILLGPLSIPIRLIDFWWSRSGEQSCDRLGAILAGSPSPPYAL